MKILIICYCYPPDPGPRAYRWSAIAGHWAELGHDVDVVSGRKLGAPDFEVVGGVRVHRVGGALTENLRLSIERRRKARGPGQGTQSNEALGGASFSGWAALLKALHDLTWKKLYWPDSACLWFFPARAKALELTGGGTYDAVISTSTPYTGHLVGAAVKKYSPGLHWMVDIGDPFSFNEPPWNNAAIHRGRNYRSERSVLGLADSVSVTVESCKRAYEEAFPETADKIEVIPPLLSGKSRPGRPARPGSDGPKLVFAGSLYKDIRNPGYLLKLLAALIEAQPQTQAHFYGRVNDCAECFAPYDRLLGRSLFVHGPVDRETALRETGDADILVNIGNKTTYQLPSKIVDYLGAGRPILNMVASEDDSSVAFLNGHPAALILIEDEALLADNAEALVDFVGSSPAVPETVIEGLLAPYRIEAVESRYMSLLASGNTPVE